MPELFKTQTCQPKKQTKSSVNCLPYIFYCYNMKYKLETKKGDNPPF